MATTPLQTTAGDILNRAEVATSGTFRPPAHVGFRVAALLGDDTVQEVFIDVAADEGERNAHTSTLLVFGEQLLVLVQMRGVPSRGANSPGGLAGQVAATVIHRSSLIAIGLGPVPSWTTSNEVWRDHEAGWPRHATLELTYLGRSEPILLTPPGQAEIREAFYLSLTRDLSESR
jgi:hypothetical protein